MDKWMDELRHTPIKRVTAQELDRAFHISIKRKVKNDATVSVHGILYEVPPSFIGKKIEIRYPSDKPEELMLYENDKLACSLKRLNPHENANPPAWGIKFDQEADKDV